MSDEQAPQAKKKRSFTSLAIAVLLVIASALALWWYLAGDVSIRGMLGRAIEPAETVPAAAPTGHRVTQLEALERRLSALETASLALEAARSEHEAALASMSEFARQEDVRQSAARLREEMRAMRDSFPKTLELERSQVALALRLLELAKLEHRIFGDSQALASLLNRVQALIRDHPDALDLRVDLARLADDVAASDASDRLELAEILRALTEKAGKVPLRQSQFEIEAQASAGFFERLVAGLESLVRVRRLDSTDEHRMVTRAPLVLGLERMQVALLRRSQQTFERERAFVIDWVERHAEPESALTRDLLAGLGAIEDVPIGVQRDDFEVLIGRLGELAL